MLVLVIVLAFVIDPTGSRSAIANYDYEVDYEHVGGWTVGSCLRVAEHEHDDGSGYFSRGALNSL